LIDDVTPIFGMLSASSRTSPDQSNEIIYNESPGTTFNDYYQTLDRRSIRTETTVVGIRLQDAVVALPGKERLMTMYE